MIFYSNMLPFFLITALAGAGYLAYTFNNLSAPKGSQWNVKIVIGAVAGVLAGLAGPLIFMVPLQSCTFGAEQETIDRVFGILLFMLGAILLIRFTQWISQFFLLGKEERPSLIADQNSMGVFKSNFITPFLLLLPTLIILALFLYYPLIETFRLSTLLARLGAPRTRFQCVTNFTEFFEPSAFDTMSFFVLGFALLALIGAQIRWVRQYDGGGWLTYGLGTLLGSLWLARVMEPDYGEVMFNTFFISTSIVVVGLILGLAIAYLAFQPVKGAMIYRTLLIWPYAISPAIAGIIFFVMFDPVSGIINHFIELLGGQGVEWIKDPWWARVTIIVASIWKTLGYNILFYIAGLQTVPSDLVEAAAIDGANAWQRFRNVIFPALSPITFFLIVTNLTYAFFNIFGTIDFLTKGGPTGATSVSIYEIIQLGIRSKDLGRAAAQSLVLFLLVIAVTVFQFRTTGRRVSYGA